MPELRPSPRPFRHRPLALVASIVILVAASAAEAAAQALPGAPENVAVIIGAEATRVTWSPPLSAGSSPITQYVATGTTVGNGTVSCAWTSGPYTCVLQGRIVDRAVSVTAVNASGTGVSAGPSFSSLGDEAVHEVGSARIQPRLIVITDPADVTLSFTTWVPGSRSAQHRLRCVHADSGAEVVVENVTSPVTLRGLVYGASYRCSIVQEVDGIAGFAYETTTIPVSHTPPTPVVRVVNASVVPGKDVTLRWKNSGPIEGRFAQSIDLRRVHSSYAVADIPLARGTRVSEVGEGRYTGKVKMPRKVRPGVYAACVTLRDLRASTNTYRRCRYLRVSRAVTAPTSGGVGSSSGSTGGGSGGGTAPAPPPDIPTII
jgi:hypothetical protein